MHVLGVDRVMIAVPDIEQTADQFRDLLGQEVVSERVRDEQEDALDVGRPGEFRERGRIDHVPFCYRGVDNDIGQPADGFGAVSERVPTLLGDRVRATERTIG